MENSSQMGPVICPFYEVFFSSSVSWSSITSWLTWLSIWAGDVKDTRAEILNEAESNLIMTHALLLLAVAIDFSSKLPPCLLSGHLGCQPPARCVYWLEQLIHLSAYPSIHSTGNHFSSIKYIFLVTIFTSRTFTFILHQWLLCHFPFTFMTVCHFWDVATPWLESICDKFNTINLTIFCIIEGSQEHIASIPLK